ncbi:Crp/Fnr family transcriptional regulator [Saccharothrix algeriensis]|uniref:CRP-like cAMP-binding protein n=1 Tax=Saccharothrix algeriensis TaxID=173560 RepID=A0A8T8I2T7_9PSEU|nr:Crp/Fnr family transcriptional regulator [Saccharothrix algeriensis]MBM7810869.1 CRP-like cAMP-binding protein [Saccharothrix algeriensis]QTR04888.1 Crp/Fnr family transcriptional regulator [Saccharothrix algeriensis]
MPDHPPDRGRAEIRAAGRSAPFRKGERLITAGTPSDEVLLVESGLLKALLPGLGVEPLVSLLGPGDVVGELGVINGRPRSAHVVALSAGRAVHLAASAFLRLRAQSEDVNALVDQTGLKRQRDADERQLAQTRDVPARVASVLLKWATELGRPTDAGLRLDGLSQRDLADAVAASEKSVETALGALRARGLLRTSRRCFVLTDPSALARSLDR